MKATPPHAGLIDLNWAVIYPSPTKLLKRFTKYPMAMITSLELLLAFSFDNGSVKVSGTLPFSIGGIGLIIIDADPTYVNLKYFSTDLANTTPIPPFTMLIRFYIFAERGMNLLNPDPQ
jgi:hypothetical protein